MDRGKSSEQSTEGPPCSQRSVSLLTASHKRRVLLPSQQYRVWGDRSRPPWGPGKEEGACADPFMEPGRKRGEWLVPLSSQTPGRECRFLFPHGHGEERGEVGLTPLTDPGGRKVGVSPSFLTEPEVGGPGVLLPSQTPRGSQSPSHLTDTEGGGLPPQAQGMVGVGVSGVPLPSRTPRGSQRPSPLPLPRAVPRRVPSPGSS